MDILVVVYEVIGAAFITFRAWHAMRIRNGTNKLEYLLLQEGSYYSSSLPSFSFTILLQEFYISGIFAPFYDRGLGSYSMI